MCDYFGTLKLPLPPPLVPELYKSSPSLLPALEQGGILNVGAWTEPEPLRPEPPDPQSLKPPEQLFVIFFLLTSASLDGGASLTYFGSVKLITTASSESCLNWSSFPSIPIATLACSISIAFLVSATILAFSISMDFLVSASNFAFHFQPEFAISNWSSLICPGLCVSCPGLRHLGHDLGLGLFLCFSLFYQFQVFYFKQWMRH